MFHVNMETLSSIIKYHVVFTKTNKTVTYVIY